MTDRIDHASEAVNYLGASTVDTYGDDDRKVAIAQVHATLALVEQQRIANLIAVNRYRVNLASPRSDAPQWEIAPEVEEALGLS